VIKDELRDKIDYRGTLTFAYHKLYEMLSYF